MKALVAFAALLVFHSQLYSEEPKGPSPFQPVNLAASSPATVFPLGDGVDEVDIKDNRIRRITLGADGKTLTILFDNKGSSPFQPGLAIWIVDKYGLPIKWCKENWVLDSVAPGKTMSHDSRFFDYNVDEALRHTTIKAPDDAGTPAFLVVDYGDR